MQRFPRHIPWRARAALLVALMMPLSAAVAAIRIDIQGVDSELKRNVSAHLSLDRYKDRDRVEPDAVQRLFDRADGEVRDALRPFGYYEPKVQTRLEADEKAHVWRVDIRIEPGTPVLIGAVAVSVEGAGRQDAAFRELIAQRGIRSGQRLDHAAYERLKGDLQRAAATFGYLDARMLRNELRVDLAQHRADIDLAIDTGERYRFGPTHIEQDVIEPVRVQRYLRYSEGEPYDALKLLRTQFALDDSLYFSDVEVIPGERDPVTRLVPIQIHAKPTRRGYTFGAGYGTDTGVRGTLGYSNPRVNRLGHRLRIQLQTAQTKQQLTSRYEIPVGDPALEKLAFAATANNSQLAPDVNSSQLSFMPSLTQVRGNWQRVLDLNFTHDITNDTLYGRQVDNLVVPGITFASVPEGYLGEDLFSRTLLIRLQGSHRALGAHANFLQLNLRAERVLDFTPHWHLLLRGEFGATVVGNFAALPGDYRFYAGGDRSVRGFAYNSLSPLQYTASNVPARVGGRDLLTGTVEVERDLPRNFGVAAFVDGGNAVDHFGNPLAYSVGVGVRWRLPVVTVGIDIAQAIRAPGFPSLPGPRLHLNISPKL